MLKFQCQNDGFFTIYFDVPLPQKLITRQEIKVFFRSLAEATRVELLVTDGMLLGVEGHVDSLLQAVSGFVTPKVLDFQKEIFANLVQRGNPVTKDGLQVNFHQNSFDTTERYWQFIFNQGNFPYYFLNRINWYAAPKSEYVTPFPLHVDIESASTCNMNCPMCYRSELKKTGQMEWKIFQKAIDECSDHEVFSVRLSWRGETLTHPRIKDMIAYATSKIKNVSFLTNAFYLDDAMVQCFMDCGVSYVAVSFDGIDETYEAIRHPAKFLENYQRLASLQARKKNKIALLPQVRLCTIWPAIKADPDAYYDKMKEVSDYIVCNPYINFKGPMKIKEDFICQYPWERIVIGYDGEAQCCTGWNATDILLGNIADTTIAEMWHSDLMGEIRKMHAGGGRMALESCAACRHGSESEADIDVLDIIERRY